MKVLFVSNFDNKMNEGMRNVANNLVTNIATMCEMEKKTAKTFLESFPTLNKGKYAIIHIIFRANIKGYILGIAAKFFSYRSRVILSVVQPPSKTFLLLISIYNPFTKYYVLAQDIKNHFDAKGMRASIFQLGVDSKKFSPIKEDNRHALWEQFGLTHNKPMVLHVGHCSRGRNLEVFLEIDKSRYNRLIICSGMFSDLAVKEMLQRDGVTIIEEYLPNIQAVYQFADVYIFPTISRDYVIDIPLSAIEALACGTPVITHRNILEMCHIPLVKQDVLIVHDSAKDINEEVSVAVLHKASESFVNADYSWEKMASWFCQEYHNLVAEV